MDFIQNEINYNLIILYIKDFIQYELELEKGFNMSEKQELVELINSYKKQEPFKYQIKNGYTFIPLEDIKRKKEIINRNGFIVYLEPKIKQDEWFKKTEQKEKQEISLKKLNEANENFALRLYYYEKINNLGKDHITIIMINPAFAYSKEDDSTIRNIRNKLIECHKEVKSFDIINISPIRNPYTDCLLELETKHLYNHQKYCNYLKKLLSNSNKIILAWGNTIDNLSNINNFYKILEDQKELYVLGKTKNNNPRHLLSMNNKYLSWGLFKKVNINKDLKLITDLDV